MGTILGAICDTLTGHRMGRWVPMTDDAQIRFEHAQCHWCRQWHVRPMRLADHPWLREMTEIQSTPDSFPLPRPAPPRTHLEKNDGSSRLRPRP